MYDHMPQKDLDSSIDQVLPALLKKAADTNVFISETADKALITACKHCSETKIFYCL